MMTRAMEIRATQFGVTPEYIKRFRLLELDEDQYKLFLGFSLDLLDQFIEARLGTEELYTVVQDHCDQRYMQAYVQLRMRGLPAEELRQIQYLDDFLLGFDARLPRSILKRADEEDIRVQTLIDGRRAKVSFEHMFEINSIRKVPDLITYIQLRQEGHTHGHLANVLKLANPNERDFDLAIYQKVRLANVTHAQVMNMLERLFDNTLQRTYYVEHVTAEPSLGHDVALDLAIRGISFRRYVEVSEDLTYQQIVDGLDRGISLDELLGCVDFQRANSHIQLGEVIRYYTMTRHFIDINAYVILIGAGVTHAEIQDAREHELYMNVYGRLRLQPMGLSHDDAIAVVNHDIEPEYYMKLRREGFDHATAIADVE